MVFEGVAPGGSNSSEITQCFFGPIVAPEHESLAIVNGPDKSAVLSLAVAVALRLVIVTGLGLPGVPAVTGANATDAGPVTDTAVPLPESATVKGVVPL